MIYQMYRISKVARELNLGISTITDLLRKRGVIVPDFSPNFKITQEQYDCLKNDIDQNKSTCLN